MPGVDSAIEPGGEDSFLDEERDRGWRERPLRHVSVPGNAAEHRPASDLRRRSPFLQSVYRAGLCVRPERNGDFPALPFLVGLAARNPDHEPFGDVRQVFHLDRHQLGAPEGAGEADQQERPVADIAERVV